MADLWRYLPLSQRGTDDERAVSSDHREAVAALVDDLARIRAAHPEIGAELEGIARAAGLAREWDQSDGDLAAIAGAVRGRKRSIRTLAKLVAAALPAARGVGDDLRVPPMTAGAIALWAQGNGPFERRAVVAGHTVRATDADWAFGTGPVLEGPSLEIAGFLLGATEQPPRKPAPGSTPGE